MSINPIIKAEVTQEERVKILRPDLMRRVVKPLVGKRVELIIRKERGPVRTMAENAYYWAVVVEKIREYAGYATREEAHYELGRKFWGELKHVTGLDGEIREEIRPRSTTTMTIAEFETHMQEIRDWAAGEGINIPLPNEVDLDEVASIVEANK